MGIGSGPTPTMEGKTIDGYIKDAEIRFEIFSFANKRVTPRGENGYFEHEAIKSNIYGKYKMEDRDINKATQQQRVGIEDFFLIRSIGGTDIATNKAVTDEFRMFLDTDIETFQENGWGLNLDIITTIASYAVEHFLNIVHVLDRGGDWSTGWAARREGGYHDSKSPFRMIDKTYNMLGLPNTYYNSNLRDFIVDTDIDKATATQQLEALVYILKNLYCDASNPLSLDGDKVIKAIGKTVSMVGIQEVFADQIAADVDGLGMYNTQIGTNLFETTAITQIMQNIEDSGGILKLDLFYKPFIVNFIKDMMIAIHGLQLFFVLSNNDAAFTDLSDEEKKEEFEKMYTEIIKYTETIKLVINNFEETSPFGEGIPFISDYEAFMNMVREAKNNVKVWTISPPVSYVS